MKTWHEIVTEIQLKPEFKDLVRDAYFSEDLLQNYRLYSNSPEAKMTLSSLQKYYPKNGCDLIDIGCGNGISSIFFAQNGFQVTAIEPDKSELVGSGAIEKIAKELNEEKVAVINSFAEDLDFTDSSFDIAFARQSLHHANDLASYCNEIYRVLRPSGIFMTVRDHVILDERDKTWFLECHPLHKYYGGENAFTLEEYLNAFKNAGFEVLEILSHFDSVINYFPMSKSKVVLSKIFLKIESLLLFNLFKKIFRKIFRYNSLEENKIPGRLYSFIVRKK